MLNMSLLPRRGIFSLLGVPRICKSVRSHHGSKARKSAIDRGPRALGPVPGQGQELGGRGQGEGQA